MDIQKLSMDMAQQKVSEEAALRVQSMAIKTAETQGAEMVKLIDSASEALRQPPITDPALGNRLDISV